MTCGAKIRENNKKKQESKLEIEPELKLTNEYLNTKTKSSFLFLFFFFCYSYYSLILFRDDTTPHAVVDCTRSRFLKKCTYIYL